VLVADDERIIADTLAMILNQSGFDVRTAYKGKTAVEMTRNFKPNMVIFDVVIPEMTGIDAAILRAARTLPLCDPDLSEAK
jgi:DNA-binding response OmpR family regulator